MDEKPVPLRHNVSTATGTQRTPQKHNPNHLGPKGVGDGPLCDILPFPRYCRRGHRLKASDLSCPICRGLRITSNLEAVQRFFQPPSTPPQSPSLSTQAAPYRLARQLRAVRQPWRAGHEREGGAA